MRPAGYNDCLDSGEGPRFRDGIRDDSTDRVRAHARRSGPRGLLFHFTRLQLPGVRLPEAKFLAHLERSYRIFLPKNPQPVSWAAFLEGLYAVDWAVCIGCLEGQNAAWEVLFNARTGRSDCLLVDALRARAVRLYPRNEERQETAVAEFWSNLIAPESRGDAAGAGTLRRPSPARAVADPRLPELAPVEAPAAHRASPRCRTRMSRCRWSRSRRTIRSAGGTRLFVQAARDWLGVDRRRRAAPARIALALPIESARGGEAVRAQRGDVDAPHRQAPRAGAGTDRPAAGRGGVDRAMTWKGSC